MLELNKTEFNFRTGIPVLLSVLGYILLTYFTQRENSFTVLALFSILFISYVFLVKQKINWLSAIMLGLIFRISTLFSFPELSDDIYRFIWDGNLILNGHNPYLYLPSEISSQFETGFMSVLFANMNSPDYYTVYPPLCQFIFSAGSFLGHEDLYLSSLFIKTFIFLAECGSILLIVRLLEMKGLDKNLVSLYALNPLVIVELSGNAHFEGIMIFYLLMGFYFLEKKNLMLGGIAIGLAVSVKLLPILIIPFLPKILGWRNAIITSILIICIPVLLFIPFADSALIPQFFSSLDLYFRKFEFNASIYYLVKNIYLQIVGYNRIDILGPVLALASSAMILVYAFILQKRKDLFIALMIALSIYFFFGTTIHPWYLTTLCALAVFANKKYVFIWSGLAVLSYWTYGNPEFKESNVLLLIEYGVLVGYIFYENFYPEKDLLILNK